MDAMMETSWLSMESANSRQYYCGFLQEDLPEIEEKWQRRGTKVSRDLYIPIRVNICSIWMKMIEHVFFCSLKLA